VTVEPVYFEPVVAWRVWRVVERRREVFLQSLFRDDRWPVGAALEASCRPADEAVFVRDHRPPEGACTCGIYATELKFIDLGLLSHLNAAIGRLVIGRVSLWGHVVEAESGWRSERAYPARLYVPVPRFFGRTRARRTADGLRRYGVPVTPVEACRQHQLICRLLDDEPAAGPVIRPCETGSPSANAGHQSRRTPK
jgi:hypothetical protein